MFKKIIIYTLLFMIVGEIVIRIDAAFHMFDDTRVVKIATDLKVTPEYKMLTENKINFSGNNLRVMVVGDSYIAGGGIEAGERFSQQLKLILSKANKKYDAVYVLDVTKPNSNTLDNNQTYFHFVDSFKPHVVILGYNINDIQGNLQKTLTTAGAGNASATTNTGVNVSLTKKIYAIYKKSKLLDLAFHKLHIELKTHGTIFPNSELDLILKGYYQNRSNWMAAKQLLQEMNDDAKQKGIQMMVLKFPEINLIEHARLFEKADNVIKTFYEQTPAVIYVDGGQLFKGESSKDYILSKYDGHPNAKAHHKIAAAVAKYIDVGGQ